MSLESLNELWHDNDLRSTIDLEYELPLYWLDEVKSDKQNHRIIDLDDGRVYKAVFLLGEIHPFIQVDI